ncbi:response regulator [Rariglobus hedericola]|uniref:Response regulator n=1 Tax=Rariglobus hedericola TaxID=2597822 RepID=A0A556QMJ9_9BACT|nr:response regulator [Rariglobus hedericola]TSJ77853.1 response regulator [Rariglobus hedericola]
MALLVPSSALIVDDEAHIRSYVKLLLMQLGVETFYEAGNITEARELWQAHHPGLVMLDVNMPGGNGLALLPEIRGEDDEVFIVILSAEAQSGTIKEAVDGGADGFLRKDRPREDLIKELEGIFETEE